MQRIGARPPRCRVRPRTDAPERTGTRIRADGGLREIHRAPTDHIRVPNSWAMPRYRTTRAMGAVEASRYTYPRFAVEVTVTTPSVDPLDCGAAYLDLSACGGESPGRSARGGRYRPEVGRYRAARRSGRQRGICRARVHLVIGVAPVTARDKSQSRAASSGSTAYARTPPSSMRVSGVETRATSQSSR
jgi:hypothetical protein